jgi:hypothetical protein
MSIDRSAERLLNWYPARWRARYGEELAGLIVDMSDGRRLSWRVRADVAAGGARERLRINGNGDPRRGGRIVLWAWAIFILAGLIVAKTSEHWQSAVSGSHPVASVAFVALTVLAVVTGVLVLAGIALTVPSQITFLRSGGWTQIRGRILLAAALSVLLVAATAGLIAWAHTLTPRARNGHDAPYGVAFLAWTVLGAATLLTWTKAATFTADRLSLTPTILELHVRLGRAIAGLMALMTSATIVWWIAVAVVTPGALTGAAAAPNAPAAVPALILSVVLMVLATTLAAAGVRRARPDGA